MTYRVWEHSLYPFYNNFICKSYTVFMFQDAFKKLDMADTATVLDEIQDHVSASLHDPLETTILATDLSFYPNYQFLALSNAMQSPPIKTHLVYRRAPDRDITLLDYSHDTLYALNKKVPLDLMGVNIIDYVLFFFAYAKGKHGFFNVVQSVDNIQWKENPPQAARRAIGDMISPVTLKSIGKGQDDGTFYLHMHFTFKNALAHCDVTVTPQGYVSISEEKVLIEDMPLADHVLGA